MPDLDRALAEAAEEVLSTMFFTMLDAAPAAAACAPGTHIQIRFRGHWTGALSLYSSPEASAEMAANFLGLEGPEAPPPEEQEAVAKELANMICGAVLSRLRSAEVFELLSPQSCEWPAAVEPASGTQVVEQAYSVGAGILRLQFRLDGMA